jgi:hypothetical protein
VSSSYYRYLKKDNTNNAFSSITDDSFADNYQLGDTIVLNYPRSSSISVFHITSSDAASYNECGEANRYKIYSLQNTINFYRAVSNCYDYSLYSASTVTLIDIPSTIIGSGIRRGTLSLKFFLSGTLLGELKDVKQNGELVQVLPTGSYSGSTAGIALYNEGFILLTGSWALRQDVQEMYSYCPEDFVYDMDVPRWIHWGRGLDGAPLSASVFDIDFEGTTKINTLTMFAHAPKSELNYSLNPTFLQKTTSSYIDKTGSLVYKENEYLEIKNTVKTNYQDVTGAFGKQVFINKIGIYDKHKNLIAIAKLATPVKKTEARAITFKLKLDM